MMIESSLRRKDQFGKSGKTRIGLSPVDMGGDVQQLAGKPQAGIADRFQIDFEHDFVVAEQQGDAAAFFGEIGDIR